MAALPYMQLYVADYLADTAHLSTLEHGAYLLLMFNYWQRGESFKAKDEQTLNKRLASVARMSNDEWENVQETLAEFFETSEFEWRHQRIDRDLDVVNAKSTKAKAAGKASAAKRSNERLANVERALNHTDTDTDTEYKETTLSGNPDAVTPEKKEPPEIVQAKEAISHLNEKTGSRYRPVESNLKLVQARLREGYTLSDVKAVIDRQVGQWGQDEKMQEYLRPATLFCASKFASYAGRVKPDEVGWWKVAGFASRFEAENVGCTQFNAAQFHDGQRMEAHA